MRIPDEIMDEIRACEKEYGSITMTPIKVLNPIKHKLNAIMPSLEITFHTRVFWEEIDHLKREIKTYGLSIQEIASSLGWSYDYLYNRLSMKVNLTVEDYNKLRQIVFELTERAR